MIETIQKNIQLLKNNQLSEKDFMKFLEHLPYQELDDMKLDFHRKIRRGLPEAIYGSGKTVDQLEGIVHRFRDMNEDILITRINPTKFKELSDRCDTVPLVYHEKARIVTFDKKPPVQFKGSVLVLSAGSSDEPVAEEAFTSCAYLGNQVEKAYDVGVACLSRVLDLRETFNRHSVLIVVAGMEGALASVVAGLTSTPVIAVPTSVGYGANFEGISALLCMLNSCAGGISVTNIDNGFGAAYQASLINRKITEAHTSPD